MRFRKKLPVSQSDHAAVSGQLRAVSSLIDQKNYAAALTALDQLVPAQSNDPVRKSQIAILVGDIQFAQGKFLEASTAYQSGWQFGAETPRVWFRAALGKVRAQLANVALDDALITAKTAQTTNENLFASFESQLLQLAQGGTNTGVVPASPFRASVSAFRLGQAFWDQGESENARWFFQRAIELEPQGATRARIGLAAIALASGNAQQAYDLSKGALVVGLFRAKTLSAWPVLIQASQRLGNSGVDSVLINGLAQATPAIRGRAKFIIAQTLRACGDSTWTGYSALQTGEDRNSILKGEFAKLKTASAFQASTLSNVSQSQAIAGFLATPNLGPREWLSAAKRGLRLRLQGNQSLSLDATIASGVSLYGAARRDAILKGLALACKKIGRKDVALTIMRGAVNSGLTEPPPSVWLLANLEQEIENYGRAAGLFLALTQRTDVLPRFRMLANLYWAKALVKSGSVDAVAGVGSQLLAAAQNIGDYEMLLDLARQMTMAPVAIASSAGAVYDRGLSLAEAAFAAEQVPSKALEILFKVARRQSDFGGTAAIIQRWESLSEEKRLWLWTRSTVFFQYIALVAAAYRSSGRLDAADALALNILQDSATSAEGLAEIGVPYALSFINRGDMNSAFSWFGWIVSQVQTHALCAYVYYWFAVQARGDANALKKNLDALHLALGSTLGLGWMKQLDARAWLLTGATQAQISAKTGYQAPFLQQQAATLQKDIARL